MRGIAKEHLDEQLEYYVRCLACGDNSTPDGSKSFAINNAEDEGYTLDESGDPICRNCKENEQ